MLNKDGNRELVYLARIEEIAPIDGYDRVEYARIGAGWWLIVRKDQFKVGDVGVYFEVDSRVPEKEPFMFLDKRHYKIKALRMCKVISQGLLMSVWDFGWHFNEAGLVIDSDGNRHSLDDESKFVTALLGVTYADDEDNNRKPAFVDKYKVMAQQFPKVFRLRLVRWLMRRNWGKKFMYFFFGGKKKKKSRGGWKWTWVSKSDQERCQNMPFIFKDSESTYTETTKIDGTSSTYVLEKNGFNWNFYVCSRNVVFESENQANYLSDTENVYFQVAEKWHIKEFLMDYAKRHNVTGVALQGETAGCSLGGVKIQGDPHQFGELRFFGFDLYVKGVGKTDILEARKECAEYGIDWVPVVNTEFVVPATCDELLEHATGDCEAEGAHGLREGYVYRKNGDPKFSFKAVSPEYLIQKG